MRVPDLMARDQPPKVEKAQPEDPADSQGPSISNIFYRDVTRPSGQTDRKQAPEQDLPSPSQGLLSLKACLIVTLPVPTAWSVSPV